MQIIVNGRARETQLAEADKRVVLEWAGDDSAEADDYTVSYRSQGDDFNTPLLLGVWVALAPGMEFVTARGLVM